MARRDLHRQDERELPSLSKGRFTLHHISGEEVKIPGPSHQSQRQSKIHLETGKVVVLIQFDIGNIVMVTGGRNRGHIGVIQHREKHKGSFGIIHVTDSTWN